MERYRPTKYCVFLKLLNNLPLSILFCGIELSSKENGGEGAFVDYRG